MCSNTRSFALADLLFSLSSLSEGRLIFEAREEIKNLPKIVLITNKKDELKAMTYWFKKLLDRRCVSNLLIDDGDDGHMGIIFKPYSENNLKRLEEIRRFLI